MTVSQPKMVRFSFCKKGFKARNALYWKGGSIINFMYPMQLVTISSRLCVPCFGFLRLVVNSAGENKMRQKIVNIWMSEKTSAFFRKLARSWGGVWQHSRPTTEAKCIINKCGKNSKFTFDIWAQFLGKKMLPHENTIKSWIKMICK